MGSASSGVFDGWRAFPGVNGEQTGRAGGRAAVLPCRQGVYSGVGLESLGVSLPDAHFHLGFVADVPAFAAEIEKAGAPLFAASVSPGEYRETKLRLAGAAGGSVKLAAGLHPWWVPETEEALSPLLVAFDAALPETRFVGEVGLDFSKRRVHTRELQLKAFRHIANACAKAGGKVLSIHCVGAYTEALDILRETGCIESCACVFHWFSGSSPQLTQAIDAGCFFSLGARMLGSKKGCEYAKAIPLQRLLLETDAPAAMDPELNHPSVAYTYAQQQSELERALAQLAGLRRMDAPHLAEDISSNANRLLA